MMKDYLHRKSEKWDLIQKFKYLKDQVLFIENCFCRVLKLRQKQKQELYAYVEAERKELVNATSGKKKNSKDKDKAEKDSKRKSKGHYPLKFLDGATQVS